MAYFDHGRLGEHLEGVSRCPHCGIANPQMPRAWQSKSMIMEADGINGCHWATFYCTPVEEWCLLKDTLMKA